MKSLLLVAMTLASGCSSSEDRGTPPPEEASAPPDATEKATPGKAVRWEGTAALLPHPTITGWRAAEAGPRTYGSGSLYTYMNGQSDSYIEYGVRDMAVADYHPTAGPASKTVQIEVYDMGTNAGAFGRWSRLAVEGGDPAELPARYLEVGAGGLASGTDLAFWKGQHLVKLTYLDESPDATEESLRSAARDVLLPIARELVGRVPGEVAPLPEVARFPAAGLLPRSHVRYGRATLGLEALGPGLSAEYAVLGKRMRLFVIERPSAAEAATAWDALGARLTASAEVAGLGDAAVRGNDPDRGELLAARKGTRIVAVANSDTPDAPVADAAQKRALARAALEP
jgi:hypothetical protein